MKGLVIAAALCGVIWPVFGSLAAAETIQSARKNPLVVFADENRSTELCRVSADSAVGAKIEEQSANRMLKVALCEGHGSGWVRPIDVKLTGSPSIAGNCDQRLQSRGLAAGRGLGEGC